MGDAVVGVYYRPPDQDGEVDEAFYNQLQVASQSQALVLVGDFNYPDICWKGYTARNIQSKRFLQCTDDNFLTQLVEEPMRREALLDLLLTNKEGLVEGIKVGGKLGCSDHGKIEFRIAGSTHKTVSRTETLDFKRANYVLFKKLLGEIPWARALEGKAELLNAAFASVFTAQATPHELWTLEESEKVWTKEDLPLVEEDQVREQLRRLDIHKSMGPDGIHPRVLRELADVIAGPLSIIFERSWRTGKVPEDWRKANVIPVFKKGKKEDLGNYRLVSLTSGKMMKRLLLGIISKHMEEKKAIKSSQHGFTKGKSCLSNLIAFYDGMTGNRANEA
ncbi:rna-directed dna polymerase from mobile element jockey-like [Limosa lapponica baueri]|uniref:Rna-directed dna polymerase from mobile element jockey-like n=1 Tax=Limosa lapponica baueri TaxID=1758121 RepID=A0A2I0TP77_LIMLA|nr:rna-directed dna polymerase from mobile element jockey-like [Limosa lapponica baueri]